MDPTMAMTLMMIDDGPDNNNNTSKVLAKDATTPQYNSTDTKGIQTL